MSIRFPFGRLRVIPLLLAAAVPAFALAHDDNLRDCVVQPQTVPLTGTNAIGFTEDNGNVTVMNLSGDYDRGLSAPRQQVAAAFYAQHPDQYDFLVVFTTFEFPTGIATAFYNPIRNDTTGLGQALFDHSADFGSAGKLQGYVDMAALSRYSFLPTDPQYAFTLGTLAHEIQHRWGSYLHFTDALGHDSTDLMGQQAAHWSYWLDTDASLMYGSQWQLQGDGKFHAVDIRHRFSPLDLYLAGFAAPNEVPPATLIRNGDGGTATDFPVLGATSGGTGETVTIDQIVAANGARVPNAAQAQKQFSAAIILLKRPGESVSPDVLYELERYRTRFQQEFAQATNGRGLVRIYTQPRNVPGTGLPTILHGSGDAEPAPGIAAAVAWLESQQRSDGTWRDSAATAARDTFAVLRALGELDPNFAGLQNARNWLAANDPTNLDQRAWRLRGARLAGDASTLIAAQDARGGFAIAPGWNASTYDTALTGGALAEFDASSAAAANAQAWLGSAQNGDGSFGYTQNGRGRVLPTLQAAALLNGNANFAATLQRAAAWIATQRAVDGGIGGDGTQSSLSDTIETYAAFPLLDPDAVFAGNVRQVVQRRQQLRGDWNGSVYLTARAVLAYAHDQRPNLTVNGALVATPAQPADGEVVRLTANVINNGNLPAAASVARWYDGDPDQGGVQIGGDVAVPAIDALSSKVLAQTWDTGGRGGAHTIWLVLDATNLLVESSESDNRASLAVTVQAPSNLPDLTFTAADFTLTPASFTTLPGNEHLSGVLHNIGNAGVSGAVVRLYANGDLTHALAQTALDVGGRSTAPFALDFTVTQASTVNLLVRIDPDNAIAEANENNNDASLLLPFGQSLDLEVTAADLALVGAAPTAGQNVDFDVTVHNRGTVDSPSAVLHADIVQGASTTAIYDGNVQVGAGQSVTRRLSWRPNQAGAAQLRVAVDPGNLVAETREDNNGAQLDFSVTAPTGADLTVVQNTLAFVPTPALQGQPLTASLVVRNLSSLAIATPFRVVLYPADPRSGAAPLASTTVAGLAGSSDTLVTINVPDLELVGDQTLYIFVDADNAVAETDETNNIVIAPLHAVALPDLAISVADMSLTPALPVPGQPVQAQVTVRNLGGQDAQNVVVRLLEGDANGAAVGADQTLSSVAAGSSTVLTFNWTLGLVPNSHTVTAIADPANTVHEGSEDNNVATLPFDVQDGSFFANQRYISPNGDGVQDETAIVFVAANAGPAELDVVNGAHYTVRHFVAVALNDALRGQVIWDGRDDHGRIVPDGDYQLVAIDAAKHSSVGPLVTVDNNRSSAFEAWDDPHGVLTPFLHDNFGNYLDWVQIPPAASPVHTQLFGFWSPSTATTHSRGLYRTDTAMPDGIPVLDGAWLDNYRLARDLSQAYFGRFAFSPDGTKLVADIFGSSSSGTVYSLVTTAVDQIDAGRVQVEIANLPAPNTLVFLDNDTVLFGPNAQNKYELLTLSTGARAIWRSAQPNETLNLSTASPFGLIATDYDPLAGRNSSVFLPRDPAQPPVPLATLSALPYPQDMEHGVEEGPDYAFSFGLAPGNDAIAVYERNGAQEKIDLVDLAGGQRRTILQAVPALGGGEMTGRQFSVGRYAFGWLEKENLLLVQDAVTRKVIEFSHSGDQLVQYGLPQDERVGAYAFASGSDAATTVPSQIFPSIARPRSAAALQLTVCPVGDIASDHLLDQTLYDPTNNSLYLAFGEQIVHEGHPEGFSIFFYQGIQDLFRLDLDSGGNTVLHQGSFQPLVESADYLRYPKSVATCNGNAGKATALATKAKLLTNDLTADGPKLIMGDGARLRFDGRVQTLSRGLLSKPWDQGIAGIWPDEGRLLVDDGTFTSLLNATAMLRARTIGRGIELSGVATDRNFAYYKLDWAPIDQPNAWHVLSTPAGDEVFNDEFLTWVPPQAGTFLIRLTVADKAGNQTTATASATSFTFAAIDNVTIGPKFISPNGDGVQDELVATYRVLSSHTLNIHVDDANGNPVRAVSFTYGNDALGMHEFDWDGRNDAGQVVPDGNYRIYLDDIATRVTVDDTPPTLSGSIEQPYQKYQPSCPTPVPAEVDCGPYGGDAAAGIFFELNTSDANPTFPSAAVVQYALKTDNSWHGIGSGGVTRFGSYRFRAVASDRAGNTTIVALGDGEEQLILNTYRYQPPPWTTPLDPLNAQPPILPVSIDADSSLPFDFDDQSGQLLRVAVETTPLATPDQWTQRGIATIGDACAGIFNGTGCKVPADTRPLPAGTKLLLRLRGERADGSLLYSNQAFVVMGGIDPPTCNGSSDPAYEVVSAKEHVDLPFASAKLYDADKPEDIGLLATNTQPADGQIMFKFPPTNATEAYVVGIDARGVKHKSPNGSLKCGTPNGAPPVLFTLDAHPVVVHDQCDGQAGDQVALSLTAAPDSLSRPDPVIDLHGRGFHAALPAQVKVSYTDGLTGNAIVAYQGTIGIPDVLPEFFQRFPPISTAGWAEGAYNGTLEVTDAFGNTQTATMQIPVLKHAPTIDFLKPLMGSRVCANGGSGQGTDVPLGLDIESPLENGYQIEIGSGAAPVIYDCLLGDGSSPRHGDPLGCSPLTETRDLGGKNLYNDDSEHQPRIKSELSILGKYNGVATLRLRAVGWSGGSVCSATTFYLDSDVEFVQRKEPATIAPIESSRALGIAPQGYPQYSAASMYFTALEPVQVTMTVTGQLNGLTEPAKQIASVQGDIDLSWDGRLNGAMAPDGPYNIDVVAADGCTYKKTMHYVAFVDTTPPAIALTAPAAGTSTAAAVIEFDGSITDNLQLQSWSLDFATAGGSNWQNIGGGTSTVSPAAVLATWSRGSLTGAVDVRLSAVDVLGNRSETHIPLNLLTPAKMIGGAQLQPPLFSPNGDGTLDVTRLQLNLLQPATLAILQDSTTVYSGAGAPGSSTFVWNGKNGAGQVLPDGTYPIVINATDPSGLATPESVTLTATIDNTPPTLLVTHPSGAFASASDSVQLHMDDLHFASYELTLTRTADAAVVANGHGTQGGDVTLTALQGFQDGDYALHAVARDGAGNATTRDTAFTLDTTPPSVALTAPADGALLAAAKSTSVRGSVSDAHLATWTLSVAPANADTWSDLAHGTANVAAGEILAWTPNLADGAYRLRLRGVDQAGNTTDVIHAITIDGTPPVAHIAAPANGTSIRATVEVDGSATDANFLSYRLSVIAAANVASGQWSDVYVGSTPVDNAKLAALSLGLADGDYVLRLTVTDKVGLSSSDQVTLHVDDTPPPVPLNLIGHVANGNRDVVLDWNAVSASDLAGYHVYRGGARLTSGPLAAIHYVDAGAPEGHLQYYVTAIDEAGNESAPSNTVALYIDHTPPAVAIVKPQRNERVRGAYPIVGTAYSHDDFKQYRLSLQIPAGGASTPLASSTLPAQAQTLATWDTTNPLIPDETSVRIHLEAEDTSGNVASVDVDVVVDNGPPAAPTGLTAVLSGADVQTNWNPNTESDLLGYLLYRDGNLVNGGGISSLPADLRPYAIGPNQYLDLAVPDGTHTYVVYAIDRAGNVSAPSAPATLSPLDNRPPTMKIVQPTWGTQFETNITVYATSPDTDIAQVQFAWRVPGSSSWTNFGGVLTATPYRVVWTPPQGTPYGNYEIRALATDLGGRSDPNPPVVDVLYADLTPPDAPTNLKAQADAGTVHISWNASTAPDLASYIVFRRFDVISGDAQTSTTLDDPDLSDGDYGYTVVAVDKYGNQSNPSNVAIAHVFSVAMAPPYSPTSAATTSMHGSSPQPGTIALHDDSDHGSSDASGATAADGSIALSGQALALGGNHFTLRVTDANGDISRPTELWVDRGNVPAAPGNVAAAVADHTVNLSWNANSEADLLGYRVFRNGHAIAGDAVLGETPTASSLNTCAGPGAVIDGDPTTFCAGLAYGSGEDSTIASDPSIELGWTQPRIVTAAHLTWMTDYVTPGNVDVFAWSGHAWIRVARVRGNTSVDETVAFDAPYRTTKIRFVLRAPDGGNYQYFQLAEAKLIERPVQTGTSAAETLIDGTYHYTVTALSAFAFESAPSADTPAAVGDTHGGGAVELTGTLAGDDATLSWTASPSPNVARYDLQRNGQVIDSIDAAAPRSFVDHGLNNGTYVYVVYAYDALNNASAPSNAVSLTVTGFGPGVPVGLTVTDPRTGGELDTRWQPGGGTPAASYILRRATSASGPFTLLVQLPDTSYPDSPLDNGTTYYYTVEAVDAAGLTSGQSAPVSGTPSDRLPPAPPLLTYPTSPFGAVTLHATATTVCGIADGGATLELDRAGSVLATLPVPAATTITPFNFNSAQNEVLAAPDGRNVADIAPGLISIVRLDSGVQMQSAALDARLAVWAQRGDTLYFAAAQGDTLYRWELGQTAQPLTHPITGLTAFAVAPDEKTLALSGQFGAGSGVWLLPAVGGTPQRVGTFGTVDVLQWSADGRRLLVVPGDGTMSVFDAASGQTQALTTPNAVLPAFSADGREIAYARNNAQGESDVILRTLSTQAERPLAVNMAGLNAIAWSPANDRYALSYGSQVSVFDLDGFNWLSDTVFSNQSLVWTAAGRLVAYSGGNGTYYDEDGWFCADDVPLAVGANQLTAAATDAQNLRSLDSAPIEIDTPTAGLPDLALAPSDIFFVPPSGTLGQNFSALVVLHNIGTADVAQPALLATLTAPDGTRQALPTPPLAALVAGGAEQVSFAIGTLTQPGSYRFTAIADPEQTLREVRVDNNSATATLTVSGDGKPVLELNLARSLFAPGDAVTGDVAVTNPGTTFSGKIHLSVLDASDAPVADLGDVAVGPLAFGQRFDAPVSWNAQGVFAGAYRLRAQLSAADGSAVAQQTSAFAIATVRHVQLALTPDAPTHALGDGVALHSGLTFSDGNAPLSGATLVLTALDANGNVLWQTQAALGTLLPGYVLGRDDVWPTGAAAAGVYTMKLALQSPDLAQSTLASVTLTAAAPTRALGGSLAFDPGTTLIAGGSTVLTYQVRNTGGSALSAVQTRVRIVRGDLTPVTEQDAQYDLALGGTQSATMTLNAPPLALVSHLAILEARLPDDPSGQWRLLAQQGFAVIDQLPPVIGVISPPSGDIQPAVVPFRASIVDQHSAVASAEVSVDGGTWQPVSAGADGYYARGLTGIADGDHVLVVRARDTWGNQALSAPRPFTVDATPPAIMITIGGFTDGAVVNQNITPTVTITDAHLKDTDVRLNGAPFISGTPVTAEGSYVLTARASDTAGNSSVSSVRFTIDRTAPSVAITVPADGATVATSAIHVDVSSEAQASVKLTTGAFQATATTDGQGHAGFDNVPLALGANTLSASATDRAGNVGGPVSITVTYDSSAVAPLSGTIQPDATSIAYGSTLGVAVRVQNPNAVALAAQALRVRVLGAASAVLATQTLTHDFGASEIYSTNLSFDSSGWPLGAITLVLELQQAGNWTQLDAKSAAVVDLTPPLLALTAPAEGAILHGPVALGASASDALSGVASVEASVDGGGWTTLTASGGGNYTSGALSLADGDHGANLRAHDGAGNLANAGPGHFTIDTLPPLIQIGGVAEGDLLNHAVAPSVTITDLHPASSDVRLNGQPYVSGTSIAASGDYTLSASATDAAGNTSSASVHFTLDLDPPTITFTTPAQNATVATAAIEVIGQTEPKAHVHLSIGGFSVDTDANAGGVFDVNGVPLAAGANAITARATDLAGNVGPSATLNVTYQVAALSGTLGTLPAQLSRGLPLDLPYTLHNTGNVPFTALPLRIELQPAAGGDAVLTDDFSGDIAAGADANGSRELATTALAPGSYSVLLRANLPASPGPGGWITLDTKTTTLILDPCRRVSGDRIFADGFEGGTAASGDSIFCNGFEQLLAGAAKLLRADAYGLGASLWAASADAVPALRAVGPRVRFELVAARALDTAQQQAISGAAVRARSVESPRLGRARLAAASPPPSLSPRAVATEAQP